MFMPLLLLAQVVAPSPALPEKPIILPPKAAPVTGAIDQVSLGPIFRQPFMCMDHWFGQLEYAGDALGTDCMIGGGVDGINGFTKLYRTDGRTNEDWYGWRAEVLAPVSGKVVGLLGKSTSNVPGTMGKPPAAMVQILTADGVVIVLAHLTDFRVKKGDRVIAGQVIALDGNNGMARSPHVHVGAWRLRDNVPLQIRWDLRAMAATLSGG
ncbi:M23 family metallopeptidase [Sphingomonas panacisoli]|uniref:M23 family metallopeptidase n=1 Tax=Sphingomonas panacisoli TaxID=1813879 RepID=A0A5B8LH26_9SPHN|nr:M23 family metallopeptidase [Sphingomonas panacisoli]QDZ06902.1 M23 family metallopeptidase [Sphingomonas panacisoli]